MALNKDFRVKDSLYVGTSGYFAGNPGNNVSIDTGGRILSAGTDLSELFSIGDITEIDTKLPFITGGGTEGAIEVGLDTNCGNNWNSSYSWVTTQGTALQAASADWDSVYSSYYSASAAIIDTASSYTQGTITLSALDDTSSVYVDLGLQTTDSPTFAGLTSTGGIDVCTNKITNLGTPTADSDAATKAYVDSSPAGTVCSVTAGNGTITIGGDATDPTVRIADACVTTLSSAFCAASCAEQGSTTLTRLNGDAITLNTGLQTCDTPSFSAVNVTQTTNGFVSAGRDLADIFASSASGVTGSGSEYKLAAWTGGSPTNAIADSIMCMNSTCTKVTVGGDHLVTGNSTIYGNLSVTGDFTCIETVVTTTSALSVLNEGTGPALYVQQTGDQPIAHFIDAEGSDIVFNNDGYVGIGTFDPNNKLTVIGGISATENLTINGNTDIDGNLTIDGNTTLGDADSDTVTINGCGITFGNGLAAGTDNSVVVLNGSNTLVTDEIDDRVWCVADCRLVDNGGTNLTDNIIPRATGANGLENSIMTDDGTTITIAGNTDTIGQFRVTESSCTYTSYNEVFTAEIDSGSATSIQTFAKSNLRTAKYIVTMSSGDDNSTSFEALATFTVNGAGDGTVYGIVDAQATSNLVSADVTVGGTYVTLDIQPTNDNTRVVIFGNALKG